jgi:two-component system sensor histidine kinase KdpD
MLGAESWSDTALSRESHHELLEVIDQESDRLNRFIEGLSGNNVSEPLPVNVRAVDLHDIVRASLARAETVTRDHRVESSLDDLLPPVAVDAASIMEVLYILLDNASKYAPPGSRIVVRASRVDEHNVRIAVSDEGPGIPEGLRERVFEKFFRVPGREPLDPRRAGAGLGLPIARRLVDAQNGKIWVEPPASGSGTVVVVLLPVPVEDSVAPPQPAAAVTVP